jgi:DNA-binding GntR family transcriptional regulator
MLLRNDAAMVRERQLTPDERVVWVDAVAEDAALLDRSSTAERVADVLRRRITEGSLRPGTRLPEDQLVEVLQVSRNTLREAFRLLTHEGLLVHQLHRGVFVPELDEEDLVDLYRLRRTIECEAVRALSALDAPRFRPLEDDVKTAEAAAARGDWVTVGTANMRFHQHLVGLVGSRRTDELTARLLAELRLAFHAAESPQHLHEPYVERNRALLRLLRDGEFERAAKELEDYLEDSRAELLDAVRHRAREVGRGDRGGDDT